MFICIPLRASKAHRCGSPPWKALLRLTGIKRRWRNSAVPPNTIIDASPRNPRPACSKAGQARSPDKRRRAFRRPRRTRHDRQDPWRFDRHAQIDAICRPAFANQSKSLRRHRRPRVRSERVGGKRGLVEPGGTMRRAKARHAVGLSRGRAMARWKTASATNVNKRKQRTGCIASKFGFSHDRSRWSRQLERSIPFVNPRVLVANRRVATVTTR